VQIKKTFKKDQILFKPLKKNHFKFLLKWLQTLHVRKWWDQDIDWTLKLITKKYGSYIDSYKVDNEKQKPIYAHIIYKSRTPIGYIQFYNIRDFSQENDLPIDKLPASVGAFDIFIGELSYIGQGFGTEIIKLYLKDYVFKKFDACFVDPDSINIGAIKAYEKAGFHKMELSADSKTVCMIKYNK
jgi:aminoglycoside 6'-N-acetyltransferase